MRGHGDVLWMETEAVGWGLGEGYEDGWRLVLIGTKP
jgi:hypothetical protein